MTTKAITTLFTPLIAGDLHLANRVVMAPLTRCRSDEGRVPNALMAEYYAQRASAGLIITEATSIAPMGVGYPDTPGIWTDEQVAGWKKVTEAVQAAGGKIVLQLWHVGRVSHPSYLGGELPVAPSAIAPEGKVSLLRPVQDYVAPRALETGEIPGVVAAYRHAAENAKRAGFDGVEIHGANGYLLDQFLQSSTNHRTDQYGGSVENRARLLLEVTDAVIEVWGAGRVGVHLSPGGEYNSMADANPAETFGYAAKELGKRRIAFLFVREAQGEASVSRLMKDNFGGVFMANQGYSKAQAQAALDDGDADAIAFGVLFLANPDLPRRFALDAALNEPNSDTFYMINNTPAAVGYTDYPYLQSA
jgi:2,4-dienoyl-CoA reductase-like NADH-dependent reductase (Old Yellow Enzyme family)